MAVLDPDRVSAALHRYQTALQDSPLAEQSRRAYRSRVAGYLNWLSSADIGGSDLGGGDPLTDRQARDRAVTEYQSWMSREHQARPTTLNAILAALDHFYTHQGVGRTQIAREQLPIAPPRILTDVEHRDLIATIAKRDSTRDRAIAYTLLFTGIRVTELVFLDLADIRLKRPTQRLLVRANRSRQREIPLHPRPVPALRQWIRERPEWPHRPDALFLNHRGGRLTSRTVDQLVADLASEAGITGSEPVTPTVLRNSVAARLLGHGADISAVAHLMGHKRLDTTRRLDPRPTADHNHAINTILLAD